MLSIMQKKIATVQVFPKHVRLTLLNFLNCLKMEMQKNLTALK